ncbi:EAL domain-containing protein [Herbaspirillum sp. SJZ099]|uniref:EAL domain-containing protein n=1 Tax=Herbaspirillum sp. SJZ099 TaxID=2572916 RepID=UPI0011ACA3DE|nr:EAL domain-containing protein [Herbaspirillum sp. SJZ099]TWC66620.1 sensor c-di-GMP phosphodiesterase-like protein [Herbaspirillum sp. SJZ099]
MPTANSRNIALGILLGIFVGAVSMLTMTWLSWHVKSRDLDTHLDSYTSQALIHTQSAVAEITRTLTKLSADSFNACSPRHIIAMRKAMFDIDAVREIGYFDRDDVLQCTTWGAVDQHIRARRSESPIQDGEPAVTPLRTQLLGIDQVVAIRYGNYNALINARELLNIPVKGGVHLALARKDGLLIENSVLKSSQGAPIALNPTRLGDLRKDYLIVTRALGDWTAIAAFPRHIVNGQVRAEAKWILPIGALIACALAILFVRFSNKTPSPKEELRAAIRTKNVMLHYQPIIDLRTGRCLGAEALVRWKRSNGEMVQPDIFIPMAEDNGMIEDLTEHAIESAVRDLEPLLSSDRSFHVSLNISADDLKSGRMLATLARALENTAIEARQIWLEATERGFINIDEARRTLAAAKEQGYVIAIDDFGTGYSSLQYLQTLPVDILKIDKSFVGMIGKSDTPLIEHIIGMARSLELHIVAEGVEEGWQENYLIENGVDLVQGWRYSKALPLKDFMSFHHDFPRHRARRERSPEN